MTLLYKLTGLALLCAVTVGCSMDRVASETAKKNDSNIKRAVNLYGAYQATHGGQGPSDEKALRSFPTEHAIPDENFSLMGINPHNLDNVFISDRDGKPFKFRYSVGGGRGAVDAIVFEDTGINGKRQVAFNGPIVEEVDEARYKDLLEHGGRPSGIAGGAGRPAMPTGNSK